jgi:hypothetical protein
MLHDVIEVKPLKNHRLHVRFDDGVEGKIDVIRLIDFKGIFASLKDPRRFAEAFVNRELGTVCWPNGADLDPVVLYSIVTGIEHTRLNDRRSTSARDLLFLAIENRRLISFEYQGYPRVAEPHDYGIMNRVRTLLVYQVRGESKTRNVPGWKHIRESEIRELQVLDEHFPGGRTVPSGQHKKWDKILIRVVPAA